MFRMLCRLIYFNIIGWGFEGNFDSSIKKYIIIVAPHTSNWDFFIGIMARSLLKISDAKFLGKSQLFKWPYGFVFRALGGYPVNRDKHNNLVDAAVAIFDSKETFAMAVAPEGTRSKVGKLKTGFYYIASKANIPIYKVGFDYDKKKVVIDEPFYTTNHFENDLLKIMQFFQTITPRHPELGL